MSISVSGISQKYNGYHDDSLVVGDSVHHISWSVDDYRGNNNYCFNCEDPMVIYSRVENSDSIDRFVQDILRPYLGCLATERLKVTNLDAYNTANYHFPNDEYSKKCDREDQYCRDLRFKYTCALRFDDSVYYEFDFETNHRREVMNPEDLPTGVKDFKTMAFLPAHLIYQKALNDPYSGGEGIDCPMYLAYSKDMDLFYYNITTHKGKLLYKDKMANRQSVRHIFIDAKSGKVLWRTEVEHQYSSVGTIDWGEIVPGSPLTGPSDGNILYFHDYDDPDLNE